MSEAAYKVQPHQEQLGVQRLADFVTVTGGTGNRTFDLLIAIVTG